MIPGVGVPHRRMRINRHDQRPLTSHNHTLSYLGDKIDMDLNETALKARQRLEKKLGHCLNLPSRFFLFFFFFLIFLNLISYSGFVLTKLYEYRSSNLRQIGGGDRNPKTETKVESSNSKLGSIMRPWNQRKLERSESERKVCSCC